MTELPLAARTGDRKHTDRGRLRPIKPSESPSCSSGGDKSPVPARRKGKFATGKFNVPVVNVSPAPMPPESQTLKRVDRVAWLRACFKKARQTYSASRSETPQRDAITLLKHALQAIRRGVRQTLVIAKGVEALMDGLAVKKERDKAAAEEQRLKALEDAKKQHLAEDSWMQLQETCKRISVCNLNETADDVNTMVNDLVKKMENSSNLFCSGNEITSTCKRLNEALAKLRERCGENDALLDSVSEDMSSSIVAARNMAAKLQADLSRVRRSSEDMTDAISPIMDMLRSIESDMVKADQRTSRRRSSDEGQREAPAGRARRMSLLELEQSIAEGIRRSSQQRFSKRNSLIIDGNEIACLEGKLSQTPQPERRSSLLEQRFCMMEAVSIPDTSLMEAKNPVPAREIGFNDEAPKVAKSRRYARTSDFGPYSSEDTHEPAVSSRDAFLPVLSCSTEASVCSSVLDPRRLLPRSNLTVNASSSQPKVTSDSVFGSIFGQTYSNYSVRAQENSSSFQAVFLAQSQRHAPVSSVLRKMKKVIVRQSAVLQEKSRKQYGIEPLGAIVKPKNRLPWFDRI